MGFILSMKVIFCDNLEGNKQWVLGIINNFNKDFRIEITKNRNTDTLKSFICKYVHKGNTIVLDGWRGRLFKKVHLHGGGDFGLGLRSTSYIEKIWN